MHDVGEGFPADCKDAITLHRLFAAQNNRAALFALAVTCKRSDGLPRDVQAAIKRYRLAAEQDDATALLMLDVPQNMKNPARSGGRSERAVLPGQFFRRPEIVALAEEFVPWQVMRAVA